MVIVEVEDFTKDGQLVGAVTHVFINDPTKGYAIFAENMYEISR